MSTHIIYLEVLTQIHRPTCAQLPRIEVKRQITQLISEAAARQNAALPGWESRLLTRQLLHAIPNRDRLNNEATQ